MRPLRLDTDRAARRHASAPDLVLVGEGLSQGPRWQPGERLEQLFEEQADRLAGRPAVDTSTETLTYGQLDARANRMARYLQARGVGAGQRVGLFVDEPVAAYVGMLAVLKAGAAYVPLDPEFPADRVSYIVADARVSAVVTLEHLRESLDGIDAAVLAVDADADEIEALGGRRLSAAEQGSPTDELAYIIYTSGSTGRPKGVAVEHASICNFVRVAAEVYGVVPTDRMYQGMTIAFDFSVEEIWVAWMSGATLVPKPPGSALLGQDLHEFLTERHVTALCCVPTLLATLDEELPDLRFLLVSGEACPYELIVRWHRPGRRFLNVYGPTEATVTATWTVVDPDRPVTIGVPLPTYATVILDPDDPSRELPHGEVGEIGIAGIGLAVGYVNRDDLTEKAFVPDLLGIPHNPSGRIYRTGDLGRVNGFGEIEYLGRIDLQVKVRGYRVELTEIESVLMQVPEIAQAVVDTYEPVPGAVELVGYYSLRHDTDPVDPAGIHAFLREQLPSYMVPAYLEHLAVIPMTTSDKADRAKLPVPTARVSTSGNGSYTAPSGATERAFAEILADVLGVERVSVDSHFFDELGANSLDMARFCAQVRRRADLAPLSIRDVYLHPTIAALAAAQPPAAAPAVASAEPPPVLASRARYLLCGLVQMIAFLGSVVAGAAVLAAGLSWIAEAEGWGEAYLRSLGFGAATFAGWSLLPIVVKWTLVGRWTQVEFPIWSLRYLRFWLVRLLVRGNPMALFAGSPLYSLYLRALGARIGKGTVIFARAPVCTDLFSAGPGTVVRETAAVQCYRARAGRIETGPVTLGAGVLVGERTVLEIGTAIDDGGQLGHCSALLPGGRIPPGERWHGSPAQPTDVDYRRVASARCGQVRRFAYGLVQLLTVVFLAPLAVAATVEVATTLPWTAELLAAGHDNLASWSFYVEVLAISLVVFYGGLPLGLAVVLTVPRLLGLLVRPDRVHPLYGIQYYLHRVIRRMTNVRLFFTLFGDSSYIVTYLKALGYDLGRVVQTGSNFGTELRHDNPYLSTVGSGTMVSDALHIVNTDYSSTSFTVRRVEIGERNYLGNNLAWSARSAVGDNCLLATKAMIPIAGPVRHDVGLLGSPCFEIPRSVQRDSVRQLSGEELRRGLAAKNRYNLRTIGLFTLVRWFQVFGLMVLAAVAGDLYALLGFWVLAGYGVATLVLTLGYGILVERLVCRFRDLRPQLRSIYDPYFWWHERFWKLLATPAFNGTPFKPFLWRLLGVKIGRQVFDIGCTMPERTIVTIGDGATLNEGSVIQCHSLEDGVFKSDATTIGAGCTVGVQSFVHYGVTMGEGSVLEADAFLMKGEEVGPAQRWEGNPARAVPAQSADHGRPARGGTR